MDIMVELKLLADFLDTRDLEGPGYSALSLTLIRALGEIRGLREEVERLKAEKET